MLSFFFSLILIFQCIDQRRAYYRLRLTIPTTISKSLLLSGVMTIILIIPVRNMASVTCRACGSMLLNMEAREVRALALS